MSRRKIQRFASYQYGPRSVLRPGDRFRVAGGPVYVTTDDAGKPKTVSIGEPRGVLIFQEYLEQGAWKAIVAVREDNGQVAQLYVGRACKSPAVHGVRRRSYRITRRVKRDKVTG